jgi:XTP/dITP diphosphohydrolase
MLKFVTSNRHKYDEVRVVAGRFGTEIEMAELACEEIQADDLEEIAIHSARVCARELDGDFFLEDAGLFVDTLGGFPGPYSSHAYSTIGCEGILDLLARHSNRSAHFLSVICYYDGTFHTFKGTVEGRISARCLGREGFGFDPIFVPVGKEATFAQMGEEKRNVSHRATASEIFFRFLAERGCKGA